MPLIAIGVSVIAVALALLFTVTAVNKTEIANRAASLAARGQSAEARRLLQPLVASSNPAALLVMAFVELEEAHFEAASGLAKRLALLKPGHPDVMILTKLIEERSRDRADRWMNVAARAWNAAGRPGGAPEPILEPIQIRRPIEDAAIARLRGTSNGFLLAFGEAHDRGYKDIVDSALSQAEAIERPLGVQLVALRVLLDAELPDSKRDQLRSVALQLVNRIARAYPHDGYLAAGALLCGSDRDAPLTDPELVTLDQATKQLTFELPFRALFEPFRAAYELVDPGQAQWRALSEASSALPLETHVTLWRRAMATTDPVLRRRAADVLAAAGSRLEAGATLLDRMIGLSLQTQGAKLRGDVRLIEAVDARRNQLKALMAAGTAFWAHPWPIHSLLKDHIDRTSKDEARYYEALFK